MATERPNLKKDTQRNSALRKCFQALVDRKQVNINMDIIKLMLKHELQVNLDGLDENLQTVLPFMLIVYIRNWPGWQKSKEYYSGKLNFREWFLKFRQYIILRLSYIIKNGYQEVLKEIHSEQAEVRNLLRQEKNLKDRGTQTDNLIPKEEAPFCISLECAPKLLTSLVFIGKGDDILLSHKLDSQKKLALTFRELINWPNVGVCFESFELSFKRFNRTEVSRYITHGSERVKLDKANFIEEIKIIEPNISQKCYSLNLIWAYTFHYLELLRQFENVINSKLLDEIEILIEEFLKDAKEWELNNSVASNTSVLFNIGNSSFIRKIAIMENQPSHRPLPEIIYCETFIPKMETELTSFTALQSSSIDKISFVYLETLKKGLEDKKVDPIMQVPRITYICLFCDIKFNNSVGILNHLEIEHGAEPNLVCQKCQKSTNMQYLARARWKHICVTKK